MSQKINLNTPISYYGGKQTMLPHILPLLPDHSVYVEPFFGGGAVFWAKEPTSVEIINDYNGMVVNFYRQLKSNFEELKRAIDATPYSRQAYQKALVVYENPYLFDPVTKAWAFWIGTSQGFSNKIGSWRSSQITEKESKRLENKKRAFTKELSERLKYVQIEQKDAVDLIKNLDTPDTFFYLDPPYVGADQGHYGGYMQEHFNTLLETLSHIQGKFLLSSYPNQELDKYREQCNWQSHDVNMSLSSSRKSGSRKLECLTFNYLLNNI